MGKVILLAVLLNSNHGITSQQIEVLDMEVCKRTAEELRASLNGLGVYVRTSCILTGLPS